MNFNISTNRTDIEDQNLKKLIKKLSNLFLDETLKGNKVAYYFEDINSSTIISFNKEICFYAASTIKILVCLILFEKASNNKINLNKKVLITMNDLKQDTGVIKFQKQDTEYSILDLIKLCIIESDNTAYLKLVSIVGKDNITKYGRELGAKHTMEGKATDSFGIINCEDMIIYWKKIVKFINDNNKYSNIFKSYLTNPSVKLIDENIFGNKKFLRKYGSWDIAYHEAGYVEDNNPYYIIILTQLNKKDYKEKLLNKTAKMINEIHKYINN